MLRINPDTTRALLLDADGFLYALFDRTARNYARVVEAMNQDPSYRGRVSFDRENCRLVYRQGLPTPVFIMKSVIGLEEIFKGDAEIASQEFNQWYDRVLTEEDRNYPLFDGIAEMLEGLKTGRWGKSYLLALVTASKEANVRRRTKRNGLNLDDLFDIKFFGEQLFTGDVNKKSDPRIFDPVEIELQERGYSLEEAAYGGDTLAEVNACYGRTELSKPPIPIAVVLEDGHTTRKEFRARGLPDDHILEKTKELVMPLGLKIS